MVPTSLGAHGLSVGASAGSPRPCTGLRGGTAATAMVMGAAGATTPLRSHPPLLLQGLRLMTTLPDAQLRRSWRPPAGVPTSPHCPKRPPGAQRGGAVPQGSGWWGLPPSHSSLLNLPERCLASPSPPTPGNSPFSVPSPVRGARARRGFHCHVEDAGGGGPGGQPGASRRRGCRPARPIKTPGPHKSTDSGQAAGLGRLLASPLWITAPRSPGPPASASPCPPWCWGERPGSWPPAQELL